MPALHDIVTKGSTSRSVVLHIMDSTDGTPETGVVFNTSGIDLWYRREGAARVAITEATLAALTTAWSSGGFLHISDGDYRLDLPDAAFATSANYVDFGGTVTGMIVVGGRVRLIDASFEVANLAANVTQFGGTNGTFASGIPAASLTTAAINAVADQVWDEAASGHVASGSFGQFHQIIRTATATAGSGTTITLDGSASAIDDFYKNQIIQIVAGTGANQSRFISGYVGSTKVATVSSWATNPSSDSVFVIKPFGSIPGATAPTAGEVADAVWDEARSGHVTSGSFGEIGSLVLRGATAQAGTATTITLDAGASATNGIYALNQIAIISGTGAGQSRQISAYIGSSKVATVGVAWTTNPSSDSVFLITPLGVDAATVAAIADAIWDEARAGHVTAGTFGEYTNADAVRISGNATSADNLETYTDGGSGRMPVNVAQISTDATAADNLEAALDGTGGVTITAALTGAITGNITGNLSGSVGSVTGAVGSVTGAVGSVTGAVGGNVTGSVGSLAAQAKADVNAEVLDVLNTDTFAEPGQEAPGATVSIVKKIGYLYKLFRNKKTQTATTFSLFADDASTVDQKATVSDSAGTTTSGEIGTGP